MINMQVPIEVYDLLERRLGRDDAMAVAKSIEASLLHIEQRSHEMSLQRKIEAKDELKRELRDELTTKEDLANTRSALGQDVANVRTELANVRSELKEDIAKLRAEVKEDIAKLEGKIEARFERMEMKFTIYFLVTIFFVLFTNQNSLEFLARLLGLVK